MESSLRKVPEAADQIMDVHQITSEEGLPRRKQILDGVERILDGFEGALDDVAERYKRIKR